MRRFSPGFGPGAQTRRVRCMRPTVPGCTPSLSAERVTPCCAAVVLMVTGYLIVRPDNESMTTAQDLELVASDVAPDAWGIVVLHPRVDGTIVDLEAGDLPTGNARYAVTVNGNDSVLASQTFTADRDGWAQVLLATSRLMQPGDTIEVKRLDTAQPVIVLRCKCVI